MSAYTIQQDQIQINPLQLCIRKKERPKEKKAYSDSDSTYLDQFQDNVPKGASRQLLEQVKMFKKLFVSKYHTFEEMD